VTSRNAYGPTWVDAFLRRRSPVRTRAEADFVERWCPLDQFPTVLDVACGLGRHAKLLAAAGRRVTGVDRDTRLVAEAAGDAVVGATFVVGDITRLGEVSGRFDAAICLWHSFGWLDDAGNAAVLRGVAGKLRPGGRFVLDVFHRGFFSRHGGRRVAQIGGRTIVEDRRLDERRETVTLSYGDGVEDDVFEWTLFTPEELAELATTAGFVLLSACAGFDDAVRASDAAPSMQLVFEKRG
jgi:SAM-dependent methyltransferase